MNGKPVTPEEKEKIILLRQTGHSLNEIRRILKRGSSLVWLYIKDVEVLPEYKQLLRDKQGASKYRANNAWKETEEKVRSIPFRFDRMERILIAATLYWGEGNKQHELNLVNSDPALIKVFVTCLEDFGVSRKQLKLSIRIFQDMDPEKCANFWAKVVGVERKDILSINVLNGKKQGKLEYGMCRVRVVKGAPYFKMLKSCIELIKEKI